MLNSHSLDSVLGRLKQDILFAGAEVEDFILYGSGATDAMPGDLDLAFIVRDDADRFAIAEKISGVLARHTAELGLLVNGFPITRTAYDRQDSQFLVNVRDRGKTF